MHELALKGTVYVLGFWVQVKKKKTNSISFQQIWECTGAFNQLKKKGQNDCNTFKIIFISQLCLHIGMSAFLSLAGFQYLKAGVIAAPHSRLTFLSLTFLVGKGLCLHF